LFVCFFVVLGIKQKALSLLHLSPQSFLLFYFGFQIGSGAFFKLASGHNPSTSTCWVTRITGLHHHVWLGFFVVVVFLSFFEG
jgi:hypothetical protein